MKISLEPAYLKEVRHILAVEVPGARVWVFGSRVGGGWHREQADLDLLVDNGVPLSMEQTARLREAFSESGLPMRVDIVDRNSVSEEFLELVERDEYAELLSCGSAVKN